MASVTMLPSGRFRAFAQVRQQREAMTFDRKPEALRWAEATERRMREGAWTPPDKQQAKASMTVAKAFEQYRQSEEWLAKVEVTRKTEAGKQKPVVALLGSKELVQLDADAVRDYMAKRRKMKPLRAQDADARISAHSIRLEVAALSSMCNFAVERKWLKANPCRGVKRPKGDRRTARVSDELLGSIMEADAIIADPKAYTFFRILFTTVCRPGELAGAMKDWLRHDPPQVRIPRTKNEDERTIVLPMSSYKLLLQHLDEQPQDCQYLFGTRKLKGDGWSPYNYAVPWKKAMKALGLEGQGIVPYLARHEGISRLFERTRLSDGQIAGLSGHRSAQALWHYKHLRNEHQRPIVDALDKMVTGAIDRAISQSHPSKKLEPGQFLEDLSDRI